MFKNHRIVFGFISLFLLFQAAAIGADNAPVNVGMIPDAGATQVSVTEKAPLKA